MYTQLIIIFVILGVFAVLHVITFSMLMKNRRTGTQDTRRKPEAKKFERSPQRVNHADAEMFRKANEAGSNVNVVVCRKCLCKYDSRYNVCPKCGTLR